MVNNEDARFLLPILNFFFSMLRKIIRGPKSLFNRAK